MGTQEPAPGPVLFGRDTEFARVGAAVAGAARGRASTLLVSGPAGVGKTTLVEAAMAAPGTEDLVVLRGAGLPLTTLASPFRTIRSLARDLPAGVPPPPVGGEASAVSVDPVDFDDWLGGVAADRAVVLAVDDLHWVDRESLDVIRYVVAGGTGRRVGVLLTLRSEELVDGHPLHRWLADVRRLPGFEELELGPLDRYGSEQQVTGLLGAIPQGTLMDEVFERSEGLPYLTRLLVTGLDPSAEHLPDDAPPALEDAVLAPWHGLSAGARALTTVLAIAGQALARPDLRELVAGRMKADEVAQWTVEAVDHAVLEVDGHGRHWFQHPLQAELLEQRADPEERRAWHRACADLLRRRLSDHPDPGRDAARVVAVADHLDAAGDAADAFRWSLRVTQGVGGPYSDQHVVRGLRRAIELHPRVVGDRPSLEGLLWQLREASARLGDLPGELDALDALAGLDAPDRSPEVLVELRMRRAGVRYLCRRGQLPAAEEEQNAILARRCPGTWQEAMALARFAFSALVRPAAVDAATRDRARRAGEDALQKARRVGDDAALAFALVSASRTAYLDDDLARARELAVQGRDHAVRCRDFSLFTLSTLMEGNALGVYLAPENRDLILRRREQAVELSAPHPWVAALSEHVARVSVAIGDPRTAEEMVRFSLGAPPGPLADVGVRLAATRLAVLRGRMHEAWQHWARVTELVDGRYDGLGDQSIRAELLSASGDHWGVFRVCIDALDGGADHVSFGEWLLPLAARAVADLAEGVRSGRGRHEAVVDALERLEQEHAPGRVDGTGWSPIPVDGSLGHPRYRQQRAGLEAWYLAELARARGAQGAVTAWERAVSALGAGGLPWEAAYAGMRLGEAHLVGSRPDRRAAAGALREAVALAEPLEAVPVLERVRALARGARIDLTSPGRAHADSALPGLTPREQEVLDHVVAGRTYAEIAEALFLSEKTVSSHISNMLRKTGAGNRHELAARAEAAQRRTG